MLGYFQPGARDRCRCLSRGHPGRVRLAGSGAGNAPLRGEIAARVCFETTLDRASFLGTGGFGGTRGVWIRLRGPKRLIVGTDAFMVSAPQALSEFVFRGSESSIAFGQAVNPDDCIMITGQAGGRQVQLAITGGNLPDIWQALAGTGAAFVLRVVGSDSFSGAGGNPHLWSTWSPPSSSQAPNPRAWMPGPGWRSQKCGGRYVRGERGPVSPDL